MAGKIQKWAFVAPQMSRDLSQYFEGILDFVKNDPSIFLHSFTFSDRNISALAAMDGIISYTVPPPEVMNVFEGRHPPIVVITMCKPTDPTLVYAHIDPDGVAERVANLLAKRRCRSYAFCSSHAPYFTNESAVLLQAYRRQIYKRTGQMPRLFRPISTLDINLIEAEVERFAVWVAKMPKPCGMFVHGDDVARKMLDTCRLKGIRVPDELRVIGTGNSPMFCERTFPPLSSYAIDHAKAAEEAARTLQKLIAFKNSRDQEIKGSRVQEFYNSTVQPSTSNLQPLSYEIPLPDVTERASSIDERGSARVVHDATSFIHAQLKRGIAPSARDIAFHLGVSIRKIENDFLSVHGHTIRDEIAEYRLYLLRKALTTSNLPLKTLVARVGFGDMSRATRAFKAKFGMTMMEYRRSHVMHQLPDAAKRAIRNEVREL